MGSEQPTRRWIRLIGYGLFACFWVVFLVALEAAGWFYLRAQGLETDRLFWARGGIQEAAGLFDTRDSFAALDRVKKPGRRWSLDDIKRGRDLKN